MRSLWILLACACGGEAVPAPPVTPPSVVTAPPAAIEARHVVCSWGSTGVTAPGHTPVWVIGFADLRLPASTTLRLESVEMIADGRTIASAHRELELRRVDPSRSLLDYSSYDTQPLPETIGAGEVRVQIHARLDEGSEDVVWPQPPTHYRAHLRAGDGREVIVEGPLEGPWATA